MLSLGEPKDPTPTELAKEEGSHGTHLESLLSSPPSTSHAHSHHRGDQAPGKDAQWSPRSHQGWAWASLRGSGLEYRGRTALMATGLPDDSFPPFAPHAPPRGTESCKHLQLVVAVPPRVAGSLEDTCAASSAAIHADRAGLWLRRECRQP